MRAELPPGGRGPSIWTRPERSARGPAPEHSRAEIAAAGVRLADARGLGAVTMRSAAAAVGTAPASLYRYVATRGELVELMADQVYGEFSYLAPSGQAAADLLALARLARGIYHRHPWLLDVPAVGDLPGPNAVAFIEHALAALALVDLTGPAKLETVGLFSGVVRLFAQTEIGQQRAGQDTAQWQGSLAGYLLQIAAAGQHPHLAAALADQPEGAADRPESAADLAGGPESAADRPDGAAGRAGDGGPAGPEPQFDRAMTRILTGLLPPSPVPPPGP
jgi:AcrR family transcriptional regulator